MSHWFYNIISFGGRALPVPVAELGHCFEIAGLPRRTYFWTLPVGVFGSTGTK
jgi:hypothetical protein